MIFQKSSTQCMQLVTITLTTQLIVIIESREVSATNLSPEALMLEYHPINAFYEQWEQLFQIVEEVSNVNNDPFIGCFAFFAGVKHWDLYIRTEQERFIIVYEMSSNHEYAGTWNTWLTQKQIMIKQLLL